MSALARETFERVCASRKFGTAMAARIAMIATTISNSMSVNARNGFMINLFFFRIILNARLAADAFPFPPLGQVTLVEPAVEINYGDSRFSLARQDELRHAFGS